MTLLKPEHNSPKKKKVVSVVETFVVIFFLSVVIAGVVTAVNPVDRAQDARDAERIVSMQGLITGIHQYVVDTNGTLPTGMTQPMGLTELGNCSDTGSGLCQGSVTCLSFDEALEPYVPVVPIDPLLSPQSSASGYAVSVSEEGVIMITACGAETSALHVSR